MMLRAKFYSGRANSYLLKLRLNGAVFNSSSITKIAFRWPSGSVDSDNNPSGLSREAGGWRVNLGVVGIPPGIYKMSIIVFSQAWPNGIVWSSPDQTIIEIAP